MQNQMSGQGIGTAAVPALVVEDLYKSFGKIEALRSIGFTAHQGEIEASKACGMSPWTRMRRIVLPSSIRRALPAYSNEVIFMVHGSVVASTITLQDILGVGRWLNGRYYLAYEGFITAMLFYMCIVFVVSKLFKLAEKCFLGHLRQRDIPAEQETAKIR